MLLKRISRARGFGTIMNADERELWRIGPITCVMISCCAGAELQVRRYEGSRDEDIMVRELYPTKSDLYERARALRAQYAGAAPS
jgi:hypothetical protein